MLIGHSQAIINTSSELLPICFLRCWRLSFRKITEPHQLASLSFYRSCHTRRATLGAHSVRVAVQTMRARLVRFGGQPGRQKIFNMSDGPHCTVYIHGGRMKDFLISPCSVYIRTLVYIWQRIRYKNGSYLFCVRKLSNVWSLWVLKIILKICLAESPCLGVQLQISCAQRE